MLIITRPLCSLPAAAYPRHVGWMDQLLLSVPRFLKTTAGRFSGSGRGRRRERGEGEGQRARARPSRLLKSAPNGAYALARPPVGITPTLGSPLSPLSPTPATCRSTRGERPWRVHRYSSACGRCCVCFVLDPVSVHNPKKHMKHLPQADE